MKREKRKFKYKGKGFLLLDILISAFILSGAIASAMYLIRVGFQYLEKIEEQNILSAKVPQAVNYLRKAAKLEEGEGVAFFGEGVELSWRATLVEKLQVTKKTAEDEGTYIPYELYLYRVSFSLKRKGAFREFETFVLRYKMLIKVEDLS